MGCVAGKEEGGGGGGGGGGALELGDGEGLQQLVCGDVVHGAGHLHTLTAIKYVIFTLDIHCFPEVCPDSRSPQCRPL